MKRIGLLFTAILSVLTTSCDTNDDEVVVVVISEERAAEIIASSLAYNTYGLASVVNYVSNEISQELECGEQAENNGTNTFSSSFVQYTYTFDETFSRTCTDTEQVNYDFTALQDIDAFYFTSRQDVEGGFVVTGLEESAPSELFNGNYQREGDWFSKVFEDSLDVLLNINFNELNVSKDTYFITSGISDFSLDVDYSETDESTSFRGTVTFLNEDEARIDFENGDSFLLNLNDGSIQRI